MPDVASVLKEEMRRISRKEIAATTRKQSEQIKILKANVRNLKQQISDLESRLAKLTAENKRAEKASPAKAEVATIRVGPASIKKHRSRLKLSQADFGELIGVSSLTIWNWETGRTKPSDDNREKFAEIRDLGVRDVRALLEEL
jgi:DNA-binding transcriptional regulator YiaG